MSYQAPLPNTGALLPVPGSGQAWEVSVFNGNLTGIDNAIGADRGRLTALESKLATNAIVPVGNTAARDGFYGVPASAAARVALANAAPRWFNTDKGYTQQYFAQDGDVGAGIFTRTTAGWYATVDSGRVPLTGFTVASTGSAATRDGGGIVIPAGCTALSLNNVFTTDFEVYEFELFLQGAAALDLLWRARVAGVDNSSAQYNRQRMAASAANTVAGNGATGQTSGVVGRVDSTLGSMLDFAIRDPANAVRRTTAKGSSYDTGNVMEVNGSLYNTGLAHDGITFLPSASTFSGQIRVYGRNPF